jgi:hypothetical protein
MSNKEKVTIVSKKGGAKEYTVNSDGRVNSNHTKFLKDNGGCVGTNVSVETPVSCIGNVCTRKEKK